VSASGKTAWLSQGFEELLHGAAPRHYDVIIVGSGYGGAIAAAGLAGCMRHDEGGEVPVSVCVLERGREYLSGMFPARLAELPLHFREGLFDIRVGADVSAVLASGVGGGSLINAAVMEEPRPAMLRDWPQGVREDLFGRYYEEARQLLGAKGRTIGEHPLGKPAKLLAFESLAPGRVREAGISIGVRDEHNQAGVRLGECKRCGDCATGCNHGSKNSLDVNLLASAAGAGAAIFSGATVLGIERAAGDTWRVSVVHTEERLRKREGGPAVLTARKLILAAGTYGSTELLLRARQQGLDAPEAVGRRFSTNGDAIAVVYDQERDVNAVADESRRAEDRHVGPTITGMLDLRDRWLRRRRCVIQEIAVPGPLRRVFEETVTTMKVLQELADVDRTRHGPDEPAQDPCAVDAAAIGRTSAFVMMGDDRAGGELELDRESAIRVKWPEVKDDPLFASQIAALRKLAAAAGPRARVLPNPLWQLLPDSMQFLVGGERGPVLTVHPLGGCPMGRNAAEGAVDHLGRVFDASDPKGERVLAGLVVMDGAIVRNALGINPALTIAALALRATERLREEWGFARGPQKPPVLRERPIFRAPPAPEPARPTEIEIVERMSGEAMLRGRDGGEERCVVELTLRFEKQAVAGLVLPRGGAPVPMARTLRVREGELRVFRKAQWDAWRRRGEPEERLAAIAEVRAPLTGRLTVLHREPSAYAERRCRALWAWVWNRGLRDSWQAFAGGEGRKDRSRGSALWTLPQRVRGAIALASRAGEVRLLEYCLPLASDAWFRKDTPIDAADFRAGATIEGAKRLTYGRRANPWRQLMRMHLSRFPALASGAPALDLDPKYLAAQGVPLFKVVGQNDQVSALGDVISLGAYFLRLLVNVHVWSFRLPDTPAQRDADRLPSKAGIPGRLPKPFWKDIPVGEVEIRLTGYLQPGERKGVPLLLIHGYSASGTTFAHHAVKPNMAEYFFRQGREVWIVDLRTSSGLKTATHDWHFEHAALADIPAAIDWICRSRGTQWIDVFAHCMGAAMFSMAVLDRQSTLGSRIRKAVLSQIAPVVVMSPANVFRGYAMRYLRHMLPFENYRFRVDPKGGVAEQLIDRLLATLPYPEEEFDVENPPWPPWRRTPFAGTRHRMDALYGRDFSLADARGRPLLADAALEHIDDLFGPLSIETVSQAIHFARTELVTSHEGRNVFVLPGRIAENWTFETMSIHGADNGLSDVATLHRFRKAFREEADVEIRTHAFGGFGHQDSLIGKDAGKVFKVVDDFFEGRA
jgi:cholesterol oxidase